MRALGVIAVISLLALIPVGIGAPRGAANSRTSSTVTLELVLTSTSAEDLAIEMQGLLDLVRDALGLSIDSAPSIGISIDPQVSSTGMMTGYVATNRITLLRAPSLQPETLTKASAAASQVEGASVYLMTAQPRPRQANNWDAQWLQCG